MAAQILGGDACLVSGPVIWQSKIVLGQTTSSFSFRLIYNKKLDRHILAGQTRLIFVEADFPEQESLEWWVIDLINCFFLLDRSADDFAAILRLKLAKRVVLLDVQALQATADRYATDYTLEALYKHSVLQRCNV